MFSRFLKTSIKTLFEDKKGFTLIELLVVLMVIGILTGFLIPNFLGRINEAKEARVKADLNSIATAAQMYRIDDQNNDWPSDLEKLEDYGIDSSARDPWGGNYEINVNSNNVLTIFNTTSGHQFTLTIDENGKKFLNQQDEE
ncbi:MAG: General secretion pathway protein G [Clostridia bacterium 41_269]|nr:MAG: General secretion pathway protein G [Clostridia bacterium 41_269]